MAGQQDDAGDGDENVKKASLGQDKNKKGSHENRKKQFKKMHSQMDGLFNVNNRNSNVQGVDIDDAEDEDL